MRRRLAGLGGWLAAAVIATAIGLGAVSLLSRGLTEGTITSLSQEAVARDLASARAQSTPTSTPTAPTSGSPASSPRPTTSATKDTRIRTVSTQGGTVIARCQGDTSYLLSWSPAQGWSVDDHDRGPAQATLVKFEGETDANDDLEVTVTLTCEAGTPVPAVITSDD